MFSSLLEAQTRYWVSDVPANWTGDNWANNSNGTPDGGGPPIFTENARFDGNGIGNCTLNVSLDTITDFIITNYPGVIEMNGNSLRVTGQSNFNGGTVNDQVGSGEIQVASNASTNFNGTLFNVRMNVVSNDIEFDGSTFNSPCFFEKTGTSNNYGSGGNVFNDSLVVVHTGTSGYLLFGGGTPDTFNTFFSFSLTNGGLGYIAHSANNSYLAEGVVLESYGGSQGFLIGQGNGDLSMPAGQTITIGSNGFTSGNLRLRNVTQTSGSAGLNLTITGTDELEFNNCAWSGNVTISSPRFRTRDTYIDGAVSITKTGDNNDVSAGGNRFTGNTVINNPSQGYILLGNGSPDTFDLDLTMNNSGEDNMYLGYNSQGTYIGGDFTAINNGSGTSATYFIVGDLNNSSVEIVGNATINNAGNSQDCRFYLGNGGGVTIGGDLEIVQNCTGDNGYVFIADNVASSLNVAGVTRLSNLPSGTTKRFYLGNQGDVTLSDSLYITNSSSATNSEFYVNQSDSSSGVYNGPIIIENTNVSADGIFFCNGNGNAELTGGNPLQIGPNGFIEGDLLLRNFTQTGATAQSLQLSSNSDLTIYDCSFGGSVDFSSPNITVRGTHFNQNVDLNKTGSANDVCVGGNVIDGTTVLTNTGNGYWLWGNNEPDSFLNNVTIHDSSSFNFYLARNSFGNYINGNLNIFKRCFDPVANTYTYIVNINGASLEITGNVAVDMQSTSLNDRLYLGDNGSLIVGGNVDISMNSANNTYVMVSSAATSSVNISGNLSLSANDSGDTKTAYIGNNGDVTIAGRLDIDNVTEVNDSQIEIASGSESQVSIGGVCRVENNGDGTTRRIYFGNNGDMTFDDSLIIINSSIANNSQVFLNNGSNSNNTYNGNIQLESLSPLCDGVLFGNSNGSGTLAAGRSISISPNGFQGQNLYLRNFTQVGPTPQTLITTDTTILYSYNSSWGGSVTFSSPRLYTYLSTYAGTADLTKTASGNDASQGLNLFEGNTSFTISGSGYLLLGNGNPDSFLLNVDVTQNGSGNFYLAFNGGNNYVGGNINCTMNSTGANASLYLSNANGTNLQVDGNVFINNTSTSDNNYIYTAAQGSAQINGNLTVLNNSTSTTTTRTFIADNSTSSITVNGKIRLENNITGNSNSDMFLANGGNLIVQDSLIILNNSDANSSQIYVNRLSSSTAQFNGNILLESTNPNGDGISFGDAGGTGTLANGRTVIIGPNGFISGALFFENFTQVGPTPQTLLASGTAYMNQENSNWGGDVNFSAGRMRTLNTVYNGTALLEKSGDNDDSSNGNNFFHQDATLVNTSDFAFRMATVDPDTFMQNVLLINNGGGNMQFANDAFGNYVAGDLTLNHSTSASTNSNSILGNGTSSSLTIDGDLDVTCNSNTTNSAVYIGNAGDVFIGGQLTVDQICNSNSSQLLIADNISSEVNIGSITRISNSGNGTSSIVFLGDRGDVTCADSVYLLNSSDANNSEMRIAYEDSSLVLFNEDIVIESSVPNCDGIRFGAAGGFSELANLQRIVVGPNGYIDGNLHLYNFHQFGGTEQSITTTGSTYNYSQNSIWEADLTIVGPRNITRECRYEGTLYFEKTGAIDDQSFGGNVVIDTAILVNSGSDYMLWGNNAADTFMTDVIVQNTGSEGIYLAHNQPGHYIGGNLSSSNTGSGGNIFVYIATNNSSELTIDGNVSLLNNGTGTTSNTVIANSGSVTINGSFDASNSSTANNAYLQMALGTSSSLTVNGVSSFENTANGNNGFYNVGSNGTTVFNDSLYLLNSASANNSRFNCNTNSNATAAYNGPIIVESDDPNCDGVYFGSSGGSATLASGMPILIGPNGFSSGNLYFREFTQLGPTPINIDLTGNVQLDFFNSTWNGPLNFESPRIYFRSSVFNDSCRFEKTGSGSDASFGANTFNDDLTLINSGTGYFMLPNNNPDDYNGDVTYIKTSTGLFYPTYNDVSTYAGNININSNTSITFGAANGRVVFDGAGPQSINDLGTSPNPNFRRLTLNKAADTLTMNMPIEVQTEGTFTSGIVSSDTQNLIIFRDNSTATGANNNSFVHGFVEKIGNDAFEFPVGDSLFRPISISAPASGSARFRATYIYDNPAPLYAYGSKEVSIDHVSTREYWILDRTNGTNSVNVTLSWDVNSGGVDNLTDLLVSRWDGTQWTNGGNAGTSGNAVSGNVISSVAFNNFSPFTLGSTTINNPLPIELISFSAKPSQNYVKLEWVTATEINNDYFTVERSIDGINFESLKDVEGAGNSNSMRTYSTFDYAPYINHSFYRLKQTDFDGTESHSEIKKVYLPENSTNTSKIYAFEKTVYIQYESEISELFKVSVYDFSGQIIHQEDIYITPENGYSTIPIPAEIATGIYLVNAVSKSTVLAESLFLKN